MYMEKNCNIKKSMQEIWKAMRVGCDGSRVCERKDIWYYRPEWSRKDNDV